jgi:predicted transcriptional regulator
VSWEGALEMENSILVGQVMTALPDFVAPDEGVALASQKMKFLGIRHLPVCEDKRVVGVVSDRDLKWASQLPQFTLLKIRDIMKNNPYIVEANTPLLEVTQNMMMDKIGCTIVVNSKGEIEGIFTVIDALHVLNHFLKLESQTRQNSASLGMFEY